MIKDGDNIWQLMDSQQDVWNMEDIENCNGCKKIEWNTKESVRNVHPGMGWFWFLLLDYKVLMTNLVGNLRQRRKLILQNLILILSLYLNKPKQRY